MDIGAKLRDTRVRLGLTQEELANRCEVTKGYISQLENNKMSPSIETLEYVLEVLGISLSDFFHEDEQQKIVFREEDQNVKDFGDHKITWLIPTSQVLSMEAIRVDLEPLAATSVDAPHPGEEYGYVIKGSIEVWNGKQMTICNKGESFYLQDLKSHYLKNRLKTEATILWVSNPPSF